MNAASRNDRQEGRARHPRPQQSSIRREMPRSETLVAAGDRRKRRLTMAWPVSGSGTFYARVALTGLASAGVADLGMKITVAVVAPALVRVVSWHDVAVT